MSQTISWRRIAKVLGVIVGVPATLIGVAALVIIYLDRPAEAGGKFPAIEGTSTSGAVVNVAELIDGKPALVNVWQISCVPCIEELPVLAKLSRERGDVRFVGLVHSTTTDELRSIEAKNDFGTFPQLTISVPAAVRLQAMPTPTTFLIARDGRIIAATLGGRTEAGWRELLATVR